MHRSISWQDPFYEHENPTSHGWSFDPQRHPFLSSVGVSLSLHVPHVVVLSQRVQCWIAQLIIVSHSPSEVVWYPELHAAHLLGEAELHVLQLATAGSQSWNAKHYWIPCTSMHYSLPVHTASSPHWHLLPKSLGSIEFPQTMHLRGSYVSHSLQPMIDLHDSSLIHCVFGVLSLYPDSQVPHNSG